VVSDATKQAAVQASLALLSALFSAPGGTSTALKAARVLGRNFPLVLLLAMIGALFWPIGEMEVPETSDLGPRPNGSDEIPSTLHY
jgi:hypothetical protein